MPLAVAYGALGRPESETGISLLRPHCWTSCWPLELLMTYQLPFEGRQTAKSVRPSPS